MEDSVPSGVQRRKLGELWSTDYGHLEVQLYPENRLFGIPYFVVVLTILMINVDSRYGYNIVTKTRNNDVPTLNFRQYKQN